MSWHQYITMWCQAGEAQALCRGVTAGLFCAAPRTGSQPCGCHACRAGTALGHVCCANGMSCGGRPQGRSGFCPSSAPTPVRGYQLGHNGTRGQSKRTGMRCVVPTERHIGYQPDPGGCMRGKRRTRLQGAYAGQGEMQAKGERDLGTDRQWQGAWGKKPSGNLTKTGRGSTQQI